MELKDKIIALTNMDKRKAFVDEWENWPIWVDVPELPMTVRRLDLPDGSAFCAAVYKSFTGRPRFCILKKSDDPFLPNDDGITSRIEHLAEVRKKLLAQ